MFLLDTNIISELRKQAKANLGVRAFFSDAINDNSGLFLSVITIGELRRGVELIRHRGDKAQANLLEIWLNSIIADYQHNIIEFSQTDAQLWGHLQVPNHENTIDKQIAATALSHDLCVVTRNIRHFESTGARLLNPFQ